MISFRSLLRTIRTAGSVSILCGALVGVGFAAEDASSTVAGHVAAGEFGAALDAARGVDDAAARDALIQQVVAAQLQGGDFNGARVATRGISDPQQRGAERANIAQQQ